MPDIATQTAINLEPGSAITPKNTAQPAISGDSGQKRSFFEAFQQSSKLQQAPDTAAKGQVTDPESGSALPLMADEGGILQEGTEAFAARMVSLEMPVADTNVNEALQTLLPEASNQDALTATALLDGQTPLSSSPAQTQTPVAGSDLLAAKAVDSETLANLSALKPVAAATAASLPEATTPVLTPTAAVLNTTAPVMTAIDASQATEQTLLPPVTDRLQTATPVTPADSLRPQLAVQPQAVSDASLRVQAENAPAERLLQQTLQSSSEAVKSVPAAPLTTTNVNQQPATTMAQSVDTMVARTEMLMNNTGAGGFDSSAEGGADNRQGLQQLAATLPAASVAAARVAGDSAAAFSSLIQGTTASAQGSNPLNPLNTQGGVMQAMIGESFGSPNWSQGLGRQVMLMLNQNVQSAEIRMNPANLGPIEVRIDMDEDSVNVAFTSRHAVVREAMEMALPRLREMMNENGLQLADTDISHQSFAEQRAGDDSGIDDNRAGHAAAGNAVAEQTDKPSANTGTTGSTISGQLDGLVDYYI